MRITALAAIVASLVMYDGGGRVVRDGCPVELKYEFYDVAGTDPEAVRQSLILNGPKDGAGAPHFAVTEWAIDYKWPAGTDWSTTTVDVSVACTAHIKLPRLRPTPGASRELFAAWDLFVEKLRAHEQNHVRHVEERAGLIKSRINDALRSGHTLSNSKAHRIARSVIAEIRGLDRSYDTETAHGKTEGVWTL